MCSHGMSFTIYDAAEGADVGAFQVRLLRAEETTSPSVVWEGLLNIEGDEGELTIVDRDC